jgi:macrolide-specific efflux system membrane fusion protein
MGLALAAALLAAPVAEAADRVLTFAVPGVVATVDAKAGQSVGKGAVLARLDGRTFAAKVASCKAAVAEAELEEKYATDALERARQLFEDLSTSAEEVEKSELRHARAKALLARAKMKLTRAVVQQERATLRAPSAGTVVSVPGYVGQAIQPRAGLQPVVVLSGK